MAEQSFSYVMKWAICEEWVKDAIMDLQFDKKKLTDKKGEQIFAEIDKAFAVYTQVIQKYFSKFGKMLYGDRKKKKKKTN